MQYGIYYAYWETEWGGNFVPYVEKCARLGFDVLEVACGAFDRENDAFFHELAAAARANGMALTGGYGPRKEHDLATADNAQAEQTFRFYADMFRKMELIPTFIPAAASSCKDQEPLTSIATLPVSSICVADIPTASSVEASGAEPSSTRIALIVSNTSLASGLFIVLSV